MPLDHNHNLHQSQRPALSGTYIFIYRRLVGRIIYLIVMCPDITYAPKFDHLQAAYKVMEYFKTSPGPGLFMVANTVPTLTVFCNSDWGGGDVELLNNP